MRFFGCGGRYRDRCGIIEAGIMIISYIYGRNTCDEETWKYAYFIRLLHERFKERFNTIKCIDLYTRQKEANVEVVCLEPIKIGASIIADILLNAETILNNVPLEERVP